MAQHISHLSQSSSTDSDFCYSYQEQNGQGWSVAALPGIVYVNMGKLGLGVGGGGTTLSNKC